ncbi:CgeB family protein [Posidoniimonas polymericola]|nr:glycosyltransferase [Posidoniimonas polymericola]
MSSSMQYFDLFITPKSYELDEYAKLGKQVLYMPLGFCDQIHTPRQVPEASRVDVGFIGSWEPRREHFMTQIVEQGSTAHIWGYGWDHVVDGRWSLRREARLRRLNNGRATTIQINAHLADIITSHEIYGDTYAECLSRSRISLGLLRTTLYPDQHTTRTFEIPACGSMLLAERTDEHKSFFEEGREADFFSSDEEMIDKVRFYSNNPEARDRIARNGRERCLNSGYSYFERLKPALSHLGLI